MIEIIETRVVGTLRAVDIVISNGGGQSFFYQVGGLPLEGDLQTILNAREAELWTAASAAGRTVDLFELQLKRVLKAFALVTMDEINILRQRAGLPLRTAGQIDDALRQRLKSLI